MADYPWYKSYDAGVPHSLEPYPETTLLDIIAETTREMPEHTFMYYKDRYFSYKEATRLFEVIGLSADVPTESNRATAWPACC